MTMVWSCAHIVSADTVSEYRYGNQRLGVWQDPYTNQRVARMVATKRPLLSFADTAKVNKHVNKWQRKRLDQASALATNPSTAKFYVAVR